MALREIQGRREPGNHILEDTRRMSVVNGSSRMGMTKSVFSKTDKPFSDRRNSNIYKMPSAMWEGDADLVGSVVGSVVSQIDKGKVRTHPQQYRCGDIIRVPHVAPNLDPRAKFGESHVGWTNATGPVVGKLRPAIVMCIYPKSLTCLPICTSGGYGICRAEAADCLWLRGWEDDGPHWNSIVEAKYLMVEPGYNYQPLSSSYVNLTKAFDVSYECPIEPKGSLTKLSWSRLRQLWMITIEKGFRSVDDQAAYVASEIGKMPLIGEFNRLRKEQLAKRQDIADGFTEVKRYSIRGGRQLKHDRDI